MHGKSSAKEVAGAVSFGLLASLLSAAALLACSADEEAGSTTGSAGSAGSEHQAGGDASRAGNNNAGGVLSTGGSQTSGAGGGLPVPGVAGTSGASADGGTTAVAGAGSDIGAGSGGRAGSGAAGGSAGSNSAGTGGGPVSNGPKYPYVFAVFDDAAPKSDLLIYTSADAINFKLLFDTQFTGPTGFLRDPSIMRHTDGKFYVAFTTPPTLACCGPESSFSIAASANLKDWATIATVPAGVPGAKNTWAPEWFKDRDGSVYALVTIDTKTYRYKAMNDTLTQFSGPTWIGIGPDYIDTFIVTVGDTYHAFTKHESATLVEHATAPNLDGPWTFVGKNDWAGWGNHKEAPALIDLGNGTWRFYCDAGSAGHESYSDSKDGFKTWTAVKTLPNVGAAISHGTVIKAD